MKMKKILIALMAVMVTVGLVGLGTFAVFSDEVDVEDNTFAAGTIELDVQGNSSENQSYTFTNIKPGDTGGWVGYGGNPQYTPARPYWTVTNTGSLPGTLTVTFDIQDYNADDNPISMANGSLSWAMRMQLRVNGTWTAEGHLGRNPTLWNRTINLEPGQSVTLDYAWHLNAAPSAAIGGWNVLQGHSTEFDVNLYLEQQPVVTFITNY
jgi:predicted ribosomally synthesized peptide with SipW-like signal peptide